MADLTRPNFGEAWASEGEKLSPGEAKLKLGWVQEMMTYQYENYLQARQDEAILYLLQKGVPEYSATQEYTANKSVVVYQGNLYMATATVTGVLPTVTASWKRISPTVGANGAISISSGGTGATTAAEARTNLGLGTASTANLPTTNGVVVRSASNTLISRLLTGTSGNISVTNPDGVAGNINIDVGNNVAQLDKDSGWTSKGGITLPKGSSSERGVEVPGKIRYNTELQKFEGYNGTDWNVLGATSEVEITTLSGDGITTSFTLTAPAFSETSTDVYIGGVWQNKGTYNVSGSTITFSEAPTPGTDNIQVVSRRVVDLGVANASQVGIQDTSNYYTATTVEGALREVGEDFAKLTSYSGNISAEAEWSDVPAHSDPVFDVQAQTLANRTQSLKDGKADKFFSPTHISYCMNMRLGTRSAGYDPLVFGGSDNTFQDFCIIRYSETDVRLYMTQRSYRTDGNPDESNWQKYECYRIVEFAFSEDGVSNWPLSYSGPLDIGHGSGLSYTRDEDGQIWFYSGFPSDSSTDLLRSNKGFTRIKWRGAVTSNADITYYQLFDYPETPNPVMPSLHRGVVKVSQERDMLMVSATSTAYADTSRLIGYSLSDLLTRGTNDAKNSKPLWAFSVDHGAHGVLQGIEFFGDGVLSYYGQYGMAKIIERNYEGSLLSETQYFPTSDSFVTKARLLGEDGLLNTLCEAEGISSFEGELYVGSRDYWSPITTVVSFDGKYYAPTADSTNVPPWNTGYWQEVSSALASGSAPWNSATAYTSTSSNGYVERYKRVFKLSKTESAGSKPIGYNPLAPSGLPALSGGINQVMAESDVIQIQRFDPKTLGLKYTFRTNTTGYFIFYDTNSAAINSPGLHIQVRHRQLNSGAVMHAPRIFAPGGGSITLSSPANTDPTYAAGQIVEHINESRAVRTVDAAGVHTFLAPITPGACSVVSSGNGSGDVLMARRTTTPVFGVYASGSNTVIGTRNGRGLWFAISPGDTYIASSAIARYRMDENQYRSDFDAQQNLGHPSYRWNNSYLAVAPTVSSDERMKSNFVGLSASEKAAALEIKNSIGLYQLNSAISEKGEDGARWHCGVKAQQVVSILQSHGLDWTRYAFIGYDEWAAEDEIVETWDDEYDETGNLVRPAGSEVVQQYREAGSAYSVRYEELLAFVLAAL